MNIVVDYDLVNALKNINEDFGPIKIIRNNKNIYLKTSIPCLTLFCYLIFRDDFFKRIPSQVAIYAFFELGFELALYKMIGDHYKEDSSDNLKRLVSILKELNVDTSYELLKKSECYHKIYNLKLNEKKIPQIIESKYILLPSYDYKGDITNTSLLQEHVLGSKTYVLSLGKPSKKVVKLAYSTSQ